MGRFQALKFAVAALVLSVPLQDRFDQAGAEGEIKPERASEDGEVVALTRPELTQFESEAEFSDYLRRVRRITRRLDEEWSRNNEMPEIPQALAMQDAPQSAQQDCSDPQNPCPKPDEEKSLVVTGTRLSTPPPSITNNQSAGVDEGDIVKQIGDYLLVLQDGRIFAVNIASMKLTDRHDVYRRDASGEPIGASWYDEMLVEGDNVLITAYSYEDRATELSVFRLDQATGRLARRGVFLLSSDDYYSARNYASRIVGDRLVLYSQFSINRLVDRSKRPVIRRWLSPEARRSRQSKGKPIIAADSVYWPVIPTFNPAVHTVTSCALDQIEIRDIDCRTTGFVAPRRREMFVSPNAVYVLATVNFEGRNWDLPRCSPPGVAPTRPTAREVAPGVVYRIPINGGEPAVLPFRGGVFDQFSFDEYKGRFRVLTAWYNDRCEPEEDQPTEIALLDQPVSRFSNQYFESDGREFRPMPSAGKVVIENRFAEQWLVYGGRAQFDGSPPDSDDGPVSSPAIAVPLDRPEKLQVLHPGHEMVRIDRLGNDMMLSGYRDAKGLSISVIKLGGQARLAGGLILPKRFESEGRSHAYNSTQFADGSGLMALPTVKNEDDSDRWWWWSDVSDMSFLAFGADGSLADLGAIAGRDKDTIKPSMGYICEVSCIDWYGNARPIFTGGRIFALMGTDLVEAQVVGGGMRELNRIDMTGPISRN